MSKCLRGAPPHALGCWVEWHRSIANSFATNSPATVNSGAHPWIACRASGVCWPQEWRYLGSYPVRSSLGGRIASQMVSIASGQLKGSQPTWSRRAFWDLWDRIRYRWLERGPQRFEFIKGGTFYHLKLFQDAMLSWKIWSFLFLEKSGAWKGQE